MMENSLLHKNSIEAFEYFGITKESQLALEKKLTEEHRFYHNYNHINKIIDMLESYDAHKFGHNITSIERKILITAALYHDAIYDAIKIEGDLSNEEKSAQYFIEHCTKSTNRVTEIQQVISIIRDTTNHIHTSKLSQIFCDFDLRGLREGNLYNMLIDEKNIFLEFQKYDYSDYKKGRIEFLENFLVKNPSVNEANIKALIDYVKFRVPKIGIYAGSFNPFHEGHMSILKKAEQLFDKVIIAKGVNPLKGDYKGLDGLDKKLYYRQVEELKGNIAKYAQSKSKDASVTLIKGLRNGYDLNYEYVQLRFTKKLDPSLNSIFIHADIENDFISSSVVKKLLDSNDEDLVELAKSFLV